MISLSLNLSLDNSTDFIFPYNSNSDFLFRNIELIKNKGWELGKNIWQIFMRAVGELLLVISFTPLYLCLPPANAVIPAAITNAVTISLTLPTIILTMITTRILPVCNVTFNYGLKGTVNISRFFAVGLCEEFVFRGVVQNLALTKIPRFALSRLAPTHQKYVDHKITRIARIIFTSSLFAIAHALTFGSAPGMLLPQFIGGVISAYYYEKKESIFKLGCTHAVYDLAIVCIIGGVPI